MIISTMLSIAMMADLQAAPMEPAGKWSIDYGTEVCLASREFGSADSRITLGVQPIVRSGEVKVATLIFVTSNQGGDKVEQGDATISGALGTAAINGIYQSAAISPTLRKWQVNAPHVTDVLCKSSELIATAGKRAFALKIGTAQPVLAALRTCNEDLLKSWGLGSAKVAVPSPRDNPGTWFQDRDFPRAARLARVTGRVAIVVTVAPNGKVSGCRIISSSKNAELDKATCELARRRGNFETIAGADDRYLIVATTWIP